MFEIEQLLIYTKIIREIVDSYKLSTKEIVYPAMARRTPEKLVDERLPEKT